MNFDTLDHQTFELLVGLLLARRAYKITRTPARDVPFGPDFEALAPDGVPVFVEVKHYRRSAVLPHSAVARFIDEMRRIREQHQGARAIFATSSRLPQQGVALATAGDIEIWDRAEVGRLLAANPDVALLVHDVAASRARVSEVLESLSTPATPTTASQSDRVAAELRAVPPGRDHWRAYEVLGTRVLTDIFLPHLGAPDVQSRSEDGLDIMDAVFPVRGTHPPWSTVRSDYGSRFVVAEFKNYAEPVGQSQVESLSQYLWKKAFRSFGFLVSRNGHTAAAAVARRRAWVESDRLIVLLQDDDLVDMTQIRDEGQDPFQIVDAQLEEFFRRLSP